MDKPSNHSTPAHTKARYKKRLRLLFIGLAGLIILRLILPYWVLSFVNKRLSNIDGYFGHVEDIDISLIRGAYVVKDIYINVVDTSTQKQTPFFSSNAVDISIEWRSFLKGQIVSELYLYSPLLRFTEDAAEPKQLEQDTNDFRRMLKTFTPIKVNRFEVFEGMVQYLDKTVTPEVDIHLENAHIVARNLSNVVDTTLLPAPVFATANVYGGTLTFNMDINALAEDPTFDLNVEIKNANLVKLNTFFKAYADFDVNQGTFGLFMEIAAKDKKYIGYVKPLITDLDVVGPEDQKDNILRKIWEGLVGIAGDLLSNPESDKIATKIPIVGEYGNQTIGIWYAVLATLYNGFIQAIYPALDYQVTIGTVKAVDPKDKNKEGIFKQVFGKPTSKQEPKED